VSIAARGAARSDARRAAIVGVVEPDITPASRRAIRTVAFFEATKGLLAFAAALGLLGLMHHDVGQLAERLVDHLHLNPASRYPSVVLAAAANLHDSRLLMIALGAIAYGAIRLLEAGGLWWQKAWAEWLAVVSGAIYVPAEIYEFVRRPSLLGGLLFLVNVAIVAVMVRALRARRRARA
jgi:uncharacterized membrane protein (DUF2068 family)